MWPGQQQPPGGEQNPQQQNNPYQQPGYQQPNPYQQPGFQQPGQQSGYQQPNPYAQQQPPAWGAPTVPVGAPKPPSGGGGNRTKVVAIVAALAVVVTAGVTGFLVLGGDKDDDADGGKHAKPSASTSTEPSASASASEDNPRGGAGEQATVKGWKIVVNPKWGTAFDVPADWEVRSPDSAVAFEEENSDDLKPIITMSAPAILKSNWCASDDDKDGRTDTMSLAATGTKGANGAKNSDEVALNTPAWWVYGGYTQPDRKSITVAKKATPYTTASGVKGSYSWASSAGTPAKGTCVTDGKAITFGFKNAAGDYVSWNFYGAKGVKEEVSKETIMKILSTVRLHGNPTG
ncbi:hypothetical protein M2271_001093 [Streptomyces sp. LBL]|uniref:hypothetical protein n=1 Tax=Streptomyces sp. LBL TaxID=2940562 RepID=UPI002475C901|nr:hypothetical protein [Streptomyces sp. LBL]MDH6623306.1 hypothetical protein [Streptomyces sp. LBL]